MNKRTPPLPTLVRIGDVAHRWGVETPYVLQFYGQVRFLAGLTPEHASPYDREELLAEVGAAAQKEGRNSLLAKLDFARDKLPEFEATMLWLRRDDVLRIENTQSTESPPNATRAIANTPWPNGGEAPVSTAEPKVGLPTGQITAADWPLLGKFSNESLAEALSTVPNWIKPARIQKGVRGKGAAGAATWNPALVADCLATKSYANRKALTSFIHANFPDWSEEWGQYQEY